MSDKQLRDYGLMMGAAIVVLFSVFPWLLHQHSVKVWPWCVLSVFWVSGFLFPRVLKPFYQLWMAVGLVLGKINSTILLTVCYLVLFTPVGLIFRMTGRDRLRRLKDSREESYRVLRNETRGIQQMEQPF
jgi:Saxitoxin biosynthesis operon protein SxtJ